MLLNFIVLVLRETLEASILISLMLVISIHRGLHLRWVFLALPLGLLGALAYAACLPLISEWFDYAGQEVSGATLQFLIYILVLLLFFNLRVHRSNSTNPQLVWLMIAVVAVAVIREGSELVIFFSGFLQGGGYWLNAATSGMIGLAIGMSTGALCYYLLLSCKSTTSLWICSLLLCLVVAGMVMQGTQLLMQADWLASRPALWDSNWLLAESSIAGQTAYAIFGYEATPSATELASYLFAMLLLCGPLLVRQFKYREQF